jgi:hypothetical protein
MRSSLAVAVLVVLAVAVVVLAVSRPHRYLLGKELFIP